MVVAWEMVKNVNSFSAWLSEYFLSGGKQQIIAGLILQITPINKFYNFWGAAEGDADFLPPLATTTTMKWWCLRVSQGVRETTQMFDV